LGEDDRQAAYATLWSALVTTARLLAPVMPFMADDLWQNLVRRPAEANGVENVPDSVHLAGWPVHDDNAASDSLLDTVDAIQRICALGRAARGSAKLKLRQPLGNVVVMRRADRREGTAAVESLLKGYEDDVLAELSVKHLDIVDDAGGRWEESLMPLLPKLGPKYGKEVAAIRKAIAAGDVELLDDGRVRTGSFTLEADEYEHRSNALDGWAVAGDHAWVVAVSTELTDDLVREGLSREIIRVIQQLRKQTGLEIDDRISVTVSAEGPLEDAVREYAGAIAEEVLASTFESGDPGAGAEVASIDGSELRISVVKV
jgi:isoleucyl-tRNA synthetase